MFTKVKTKNEIENMRTGGRMLAEVLNLLVRQTHAGMTTLEVNELAEAHLKKLGGKPAFKGYQGFPAGLCISVNDAVVHGIPGDYVLQDGDVVGLDFGVNYNGMITDAARTVIVGSSSNEDVKTLVETTQKALDAGIARVIAGCQTGDIAAAVQSVLEAQNLGIVRDLVGHGVGHQLHEDPNIPNFGQAGRGPILKAGMTIAIEPMATLGTHRVYQDRDNWTIRTYDGSLAAHFEDTVLITKDGYEILTRLI